MVTSGNAFSGKIQFPTKSNSGEMLPVSSKEQSSLDNVMAFASQLGYFVVFIKDGESLYTANDNILFLDAISNTKNSKFSTLDRFAERTFGITG